MLGKALQLGMHTDGKATSREPNGLRVTPAICTTHTSEIRSEASARFVNPHWVG